ncbi:maleylacetate reductase [Rhodococcus sp. NCIMB 12038]|uniref:maleylacetate reductase n=1 Tax=Rhodococcus sp. NCIMB 12038 TaxID=933800 RepID=UPI000B3C09DB|nr:maleylacetate reductase [Rhodococcus sp. NCIMB 12038]OUS91383.1 maleylacetate reductase [Rhodococcus sp. NCIMB 12038]
MEFDHETLGQRVLFGTHKAAANLSEEVRRRGAERVMLIDGTGVGLGDKLSVGLPIAFRHNEVGAHVPIEIARTARAVAVSGNVDLLVCVGGGSTTGLAKAVAIDTGLPIVAVPTTYAGSEATDVWGLTENSRKTTGSDELALPRTVIYDAALTFDLPSSLSVASGLNALAHCVDSMWAPRADPINQALAAEGIRVLNRGLPRIARDPYDIFGREECLYGAYLSAVAFASAGSGMHHKICHVLGGAYNLPHADMHACVLPHVLAFNATAAPDAASRIAEAFGTVDAPSGLARLRAALDAPHALRDYGFDEDSIPEAVQLILPVIPESNPRRVDADVLAQLLHAACTGVTSIFDPTDRY